MAEGHADPFGDAIACFNSAETREEYERALSRVMTVLPDSTGENLATARLLRGQCLLVLGRPDQAHSTLRELLDDLSSSPGLTPSPVATAARLALAEALRASGRRREAIDAFLAVVPYFHDKGDGISEGNVHRTVGLIWQELGELGYAVDSLQTSREVLERAGPSPLLQRTLYALGHAHHLAGDTERAIQFEEDALRLAREFGDEEVKSQLIQNLAEFTFAIQDFRRAIRYVSMRLATARAENDEESVLRYVSYLGACHTETGACRKALDAYDEARRILLATGREDSILFAMTELGCAQVMVDLKRFDEARPLLLRARQLMVRMGSDTDLLDRIQRRLDRETSGPLIVDCAHRVLQLALKGSTKGLAHSNPRPAVDLLDERFVTSELSAEDRSRLSNLAEDLGADFLQARYETASGARLPGGMYLPTRFEYVDDVHEFEIKWSAFKKERRDAKHRAEVQAAWEHVKDRFRVTEGRFRGRHVELLEYLSQLARIARAYAELNEGEAVRRVALHAADFIEMQTDDPMMAAAIWPIRLRLLLAAHAVSDSGVRELLTVEMRRCLDRQRDVFRLLDASRQIAALSAFIVQTWYEAARDVLGADGYAHLVELVAGHAHELDVVDRIRHAIAVGSQDPARGTEILDALVAEATRQNPGRRIILVADFETARAVMRFRSECPDRAACEKRYGPFAPYVHRDVRSWDDSVFAEAPGGEFVSLGRHSVHAFTDGNLIAMKRDAGDAYIATLIHETEHRQFRAGQQLRVDDGRWLPVKRDVPTAAALTYLLMLKGARAGSLPDPGLRRLFEIGLCSAHDDPETAVANVRHALRHFDDLGTQEPASSYASGALLLGIAFGLYDIGQNGQVESYIHHLSVMDHDEAYEFGRREARLGL